MRKTLIAAAVLGAAALAPSAAHAQGKAAEIARAEALFNEAKAMQDKDVAGACAKFAESQKLDPQLGTLLNLALCNEQLGKTASAWAEFNEVVGLATRAGQAKRADFAKARAAALEPGLARMKVDLAAAPADVTLKLDGEPVDVTAARTTTVPIDPGKHALVASASKKNDATVPFEAAKAPAITNVVVPALADAPPGAVAAVGGGSANGGSANGAPASGAPANGQPTEGGSPWRTAGFVTGGIGAAGIVFGLVAGGLALSNEGTAEDDCKAFACSSSNGYDASQSAHTWATISTVSVIAGAALVAAGAVMIFVLPGDKSEKQTAFARDLAAGRIRF